MKIKMPNYWLFIPVVTIAITAILFWFHPQRKSESKTVNEPFIATIQCVTPDGQNFMSYQQTVSVGDVLELPATSEFDTPQDVRVESKDSTINVRYKRKDSEFVETDYKKTFQNGTYFYQPTYTPYREYFTLFEGTPNAKGGQLTESNVSSRTLLHNGGKDYIDKWRTSKPHWDMLMGDYNQPKISFGITKSGLNAFGIIAYKEE